jgi:hypothetical protein
MADKEWLQRFENTKRYLDSVRVDIVDSEQGVLANMGIEIRRSFKKLDYELLQLHDTLDSSSLELPSREQTRRKKMLSTLQQDRAELEFKGASAIDSRERKALLGKGKGHAMEHPAEPANALPMEDEQILQLQRDVLQQQEVDLDSLHDTIQRTKHIGLLIGNELNEHNKLLSGLEDDVNATTHRIQNERRRVDKLLMKSKATCGVCVLFLLIVGLSLLMLIVLGVIKV